MSRSGADQRAGRPAAPHAVAVRAAAALALSAALGLAGAVGAQSEPASEPPSLELSGPVLQRLAELQEDWLDWLASYYQGDEERSEVALAGLLISAEELGMRRLPNLSLGAAAAAVRVASRGEFAAAARGLEAARRLDPDQPEVEFAAARVARLEGSYASAVRHWFGGHARILRLPMQRAVFVVDVVLWLLSAMVLTGVAFVILQMATKGTFLFADLLNFAARFVPRFLAYGVALLLLVWPILLPSGPLWLLVYWAILMWSYASPSERVLLAGVWVVLGVAPILVNDLRQRVAVATAPEIRMLDNLVEGRLDGAVFSDLASLRAVLPESSAMTHLMADLNRQLDQWEAARELYHRVLEAEPDTPTALVDIGSCYFQRGDFDQAIDYYQRASGYPESAAAAYFNLSQTYSEMYRFDDGARALRAAQALDNPAVGRWITEAADNRVITLGGGLTRAEELRQQFFEVWRSGEIAPDWAALWRRTLSLPLAVVFLLTAVGIHLVRRRGKGRLERPQAWWQGEWDLLRRVFLPGFPEAERGSWVRAYLALLVPIGLVTLPLLDHLGYRVPLVYGPARLTAWILAGFGLTLYFGLRLVREFRAA